MSKWTPGPWQCGRFHETGPVAGIPIDAEAADESIARAWLVDDPQECKANARLIAAAPEMATMIERLLDRGGWWYPCDPLVVEAHALLARINGDEK